MATHFGSVGRTIADLDRSGSLATAAGRGDGGRVAPGRAAAGRGVPGPPSRARRRGGDPADLRGSLPPPGGRAGGRSGRDPGPVPAMAGRAGDPPRLPPPDGACPGAPPPSRTVGEVLGGFRLLAELGRGASGRIFLASQPSLADRPVVLKVTPRGQEEHLSLARLQHMNIVPLYSEQVLLARDLRVLCMPYLGGATLAQILETLRDRPPARRTGKHLLEALDRIQASAADRALPARGHSGESSPGRRTSRRSAGSAPASPTACSTPTTAAWCTWTSSPRTCCWRPTASRCSSTSTWRGGRSGPDGPPPTWLGGTPEYASPEQREAMAAVSRGRAVRVAVDGRSDLLLARRAALRGSRRA